MQPHAKLALCCPPNVHNQCINIICSLTMIMATKEINSDY
jgi:hypothetical protein